MGLTGSLALLETKTTSNCYLFIWLDSVGDEKLLPTTFSLFELLSTDIILSQLCTKLQIISACKLLKIISTTILQTFIVFRMLFPQTPASMSARCEQE